MAESAILPYTQGWDHAPSDTHMPERKSEAGSTPDLRVVKKAPQDEIHRSIRALLDALADVHLQDAELRQLWMETHWLKSDFEHGVLSIPANWELMILQIARGQVTASIRRHSEIVHAATALGQAIKKHVTQQVRD